MGEVEGDWTYSVENNQATITGYNGAGGALVIPSTVGGYAVVKIGTSAFYGKTSITSITMPDSVTSIEFAAFSGCTGLTGTLTIPNSVATIGDGAFSWCAGLTGTLTIPNSVTTIGDAAFSGCTGLTGTLTIPNSVATIGDSAFFGCTGLTGTLTIPNSVTSIEHGAFSGCTGLGTLTIPNSVTSIGNNAFYGCTGLTGTLTIPNSVTSIEHGAFNGCTGLTGTLTIPNSVTSIGDNPFSGCTGLTEFFVHPDNLNYCSENGVLFDKLKTNLITCPGGKAGAYTIPSSVTSINDYAFRFCVSLASITIPNSVTRIPVEAFAECSGLTEIFVHPDNLTYSSEDGVLYDKLKTNLIKFPAGRAGAYTIPSSVTNIEGSAFSGCTGLTEIFVHPDNLTYSSEDGVLFDKLKTNLITCPRGKTGAYTIPSSVTSIGVYAFYFCASLTSVTIPKSVTSISFNIRRPVFMHCTSLTAISVDSDNPNYCSEDGVLFNKTKTKLITCPGGKTGAYTIPSSVTNIEARAFRFCVSLASIIIPNSVTRIPVEAFAYCTSLTSVTIPSSVAQIDSQSFSSCTSIVNILIPNSVTSIGFGLFGGTLFNSSFQNNFGKCTSLERVLLPLRFEPTYPDLGLTASQVSFYDASSSSFIAGQQSVVSDPIANNLYTSSQYSDNFVLGRNSVLNSPNTHNLYTATQMQTLAFGDLVLTKNPNGSFTLNYDIEQSTDLQNWSTYAPLSMPLTGLPEDKAFVRIKAKQ